MFTKVLFFTLESHAKRGCVLHDACFTFKMAVTTAEHFIKILISNFLLIFCDFIFRWFGSVTGVSEVKSIN